MPLTLDRYQSPIGRILLVHEGNDLVALDFADFEPRMMGFLTRRYGAADLKPGHGRHLDALAAYFAGDLGALDEIPVSLDGDGFTAAVWRALRAIPAGQSWSYGELAAHLGRPAASRAVGMANSRNPVALALPCHRVIGANGALTGYAGGLHRKQWLLRHEGVILS